jgi:hypothetical protein
MGPGYLKSVEGSGNGPAQPAASFMTVSAFFVAYLRAGLGYNWLLTVIRLVEKRNALKLTNNHVSPFLFRFFCI